MRKGFRIWTLIAVGSLLAQAEATTLDDACTVNILNRTVQVDAQGGWSMPNVPSTMGKVRARVTCIRDGETLSGQTDFFTVNRNGVTDTGPFLFGDPDPPPRRLDVTPAGTTTLTEAGQGVALTVTATYPDDSTRDVTPGSTGTNYISSNPAIAEAGENGLITARASGRALITIRQDGVIAVKQISVITAGDADGDGLPDDYERDNGLNPNDPVDALEDQDGDGLSALDEFNNGTDLNDPDSDDDGIADGEEVVAGEDGFITNPLLRDSDGDDLSDRAEILAGSDPNDASSANYSALLVSLDIEPKNPVLIYNTVFTEASRQLRITGTLSTGEDIDLTAKARGTGYQTSDIQVIGFGARDGQIFAGFDGSATVTVTNGAVSASTTATVQTFEPQRLGFVAIPGYANNVDVAGDLAYVAAGSAGLQIVDTAGVKEPDPAQRTNPVIVASLDTPGNANDVKLAGDYALIADGNRGLRVIDVTDLGNLQEIGSYDSAGGSAWDAVVYETRAYLANGSGGLEIIDFTNPSAPILLGQIATANTAKGVAVSEDGNLAVVAVGSSGIQTIDVSDPANPQSITTLDTGEGGDVTLQDGYAYVSGRDGGFSVVDVTDPGNPIQGITIPVDLGGRVADIAVTDKLAFNAEYFFENGVPIIGIEDPEIAHQRTVLFFRQNGSGFRDDNGTGIAVDASFVYLTAAYRDISENGTNGTTALYIGQYLARQDNLGVAPTVSITEPAEGTQVMEGARLPIKIDASDDIAVVGVDLYADTNDGAGDQLVATDNTTPYNFTYTVPLDITQLLISAEAYDLASNVGQTPYTLLSVIPDLGTTVTGQVVGEDASPIASANVDCVGVTGQSGADGNFTLVDVPTALKTVQCTVRYPSPTGGIDWVGRSEALSTVAEGITEVGTLEIGDELVAYYPFNGNADDESGNGNHATVHGAEATEDRFGRMGTALEFNGLDDHVFADQAISNDGIFSITFWFRDDSSDENIRRWVSTTDDVFNSETVCLREEYGKLALHALGGSSFGVAELSWKDDQWHLFSIVSDGETISGFLDAHLVAQHDILRPAPETGLYIGGYYAGNSQRPEYTSGAIDEIHLFRRALSPDDLELLYRAQVDVVGRVVTQDEVGVSGARVSCGSRASVTIGDGAFQFDEVASHNGTTRCYAFDSNNPPKAGVSDVIAPNQTGTSTGHEIVLGDSSFSVLSNEHVSGENGKFFNFHAADIDALFGTTEWGGMNFRVLNHRTGKMSTAILWRYANGGSIGDAHGRWDDRTASAGDWEPDDRASIVLRKLQTTVLSNDHAYDWKGLGFYFNFDTMEINTELGGEPWSDKRFIGQNERTGKRAKLVIWRSTNGGSIGDGHGRWDDGTASAGQWEVGDEVTILY